MATEKTFRCSVITPEETVYEGSVRSVVMPAHDGEVGVLRDRAPLVCQLGIGELRLEIEGGRERYFVDGGFAKVLDNDVVILTQRAVKADRIDVSAAESALASAREMRIRDDVSARRREEAMRRARVQIRMGRRG